MKKNLTLFFILFVCLTIPFAHGEEARYQAEVAVDFQLRDSPQENGKRILLIKEDSKVTVSEYGEEWSKIMIGQSCGYARSKWLCKFVALEPLTNPVPGFQKPCGIARITAPTLLHVPGYSGNTLSAGDVIAIKDFMSNQARVSMMREEACLPGSAFIFETFVPWEGAVPGDLISAYTTYYNAETGGRLALNRAFNIELAAQRVHAAIIQSQESFSFNRLCSPYKKSNGYLMAPNISQDGKGYGGGVCQLSTTLYNAALGLPLKIEKWEVHRKRGVDYIAQYFDAAVGSYSDLSFTNLLPYPVKLEVLTQNGALTVLIRRSGETHARAFEAGR